MDTKQSARQFLDKENKREKKNMVNDIKLLVAWTIFSILASYALFIVAANEEVPLKSPDDIDYVDIDGTQVWMTSSLPLKFPKMTTAFSVIKSDGTGAIILPKTSGWELNMLYAHEKCHLHERKDGFVGEIRCTAQGFLKAFTPANLTLRKV